MIFMSVKKPTNLKILEGNPGKRKLSQNEIKPKIKLLKCPTWLHKDAKKEWRKIAPILNNLGLLTESDQMIFAGYCQNYARWKQAEIELSNSDLLVLGQRGYTQNPLTRISQSYFTKMKICIEKLGLSPSDRANLEITGLGDKNKIKTGMEKYLTGI